MVFQPRYQSQTPTTSPEGLSGFSESMHEGFNTEVRVNPDFYVHMSIMACQSCLQKENVQDGFIQYCINVNHLEGICVASGKIDKEYLKDVDAFKETIKGDLKELGNRMQLADFKFNRLMHNIFDSKMINEPMRL